MASGYIEQLKKHVAPHAGAWIEMPMPALRRQLRRSPLTQGRGLKYERKHPTIPKGRVAPHAGAWIEMVCSRTC